MKSNTKRIFVATTLIAALAFGISYYINEKSNEIVVAKVNGEKILKSEVERKLQSVFESQSFGANQGSNIQVPEISNLPKEVIEILAKEIYLDKKIVKKAKKSGITKDRKLKHKITEAKNRIIRQAYIDSIIESEITEEAINEKYIELSHELAGKKEFLLYHIVIKNENEANKLYNSLNRGASFEKLAKKDSIDPESSQDGGKLGYILEDNMIEEIATAVSKLKENQISKPIKTRFGWHLVKYTDTREAKALPFEVVKNNIRQQLIQDEVNEVSAEIIKDANIEILIESEKTITPETLMEEDQVSVEKSDEQQENEKEEQKTDSEENQE